MKAEKLKNKRPIFGWQYVTGERQKIVHPLGILPLEAAVGGCGETGENIKL